MARILNGIKMGKGLLMEHLNMEMLWGYGLGGMSKARSLKKKYIKRGQEDI